MAVCQCGSVTVWQCDTLTQSRGPDGCLQVSSNRISFINTHNNQY